MDQYIFNQVEVEKQFILFFLCGTVFKQKDKSDKRKILKEYLESIDTKYKAIILEQNFIFREKSTKDYLAYDEIFLKNLYDVELLTSLLVEKVFIIHESISTAAELGMFAANEDIVHKTCLLVPDKYNVEEKKISKFIELAFLRRKPFVNTIYYYPIVKENRISLTKSDYYTYFYNDTIGENLSKNIQKFIKYKLDLKVNLHIKKSNFNKPIRDYITYYINRKNKKINIYLPIEAIKIQIISLFNIGEFVTRVRKINNIKDAVTEVQETYENLLSNTIGEIEGVDIKEYNVDYYVTRHNEQKLRDRRVIAYILYLLQAMKMIELPSEGEKFTIKINFKEVYEKYNNSIKKVSNKKISFLEGKYYG